MDIVDGLRLVAGAPTDRLDCFNCHSRMREAADEITRLRAELAVARSELAVSVGHLSRLAQGYGCEDFTTAVDDALAAKGE